MSWNLWISLWGVAALVFCLWHAVLTAEDEPHDPDLPET